MYMLNASRHEINTSTQMEADAKSKRYIRGPKNIAVYRLPIKLIRVGR